jgi:hypothetical protein
MFPERKVACIGLGKPFATQVYEVPQYSKAVKLNPFLLSFFQPLHLFLENT